MISSLKQVSRRRVAAVAAISVAATAFASTSAQADPQQYDALVGVGSDTTQDVMNAMAGFSNGRFYTPVSSGAPDYTQVVSFDAGTDCIIAKVGAPVQNRSNGSTQGRRALSRALDGGLYGNSTCGGPVDVSGLVDFARSSSGVSAGGTGPLSYVPVGRDALSFAYYRTDGGPVTTLSRDQLVSLFTTGRQTLGGISILPCGIQDGSGTFSFWNSALGITATENAATAECRALGVGDAQGRLQENDGVLLKQIGDTADAAVNGTQVVIGFSAGAFIAKSNGVAEPAPPAGVGIGAITGGSGPNLGVPVTGTAPNLTPVTSFYNDGTFGRRVFNVLPATLINSPFGNATLKALFKGPGAKLCTNTSVIQTFGFLPTPECGDSTTYLGPLISGQL